MRQNPLMKISQQLFFVLICSTLVLTSCTPAQPAASETPTNLPPTLTPRPSATLTATSQPTATKTHIPTSTRTYTAQPAATHTPIPSPTQSPTFDPASVVTYTPIPAVQCPLVQPEDAPKPDFLDVDDEDDYDRMVLDYLNTYGPLPLKYAYEQRRYPYLIYQDLTNDGIADLGVLDNGYHIFSCIDGEYQIIFKHRLWYLATCSDRILDVQDGNGNGIPEIVFLVDAATQCTSIYTIYEWDGTGFKELLASRYPGDERKFIKTYADCDIKYTPSRQSLVLYDVKIDVGTPVWSIYASGLPWRNEYLWYHWNGLEYVLYYREFSPPQYRFQAVHDGDLFVSYGNYDRALDLFQQAIIDNALEGWSEEHRQYEFDIYWASYTEIDEESSLVMPEDDPEERPNLSAYSQFRMLWTYLKTGKTGLAQEVYSGLIDDYPVDTPGSVYAEMADLLWNGYQMSGDLEHACEAVQSYSIKNARSVFRYITSGIDTEKWGAENWEDYILFGDQGSSMEYSPELICPVADAP